MEWNPYDIAFLEYDFIVLNDKELVNVINHLDVFKANIHLINVADWKKSQGFADELRRELKKYNESTMPINDVRTKHYSDDQLFAVESKIETYLRLKNTNGIYFYMMSVFCVLFFFGTFAILYLNLFSDLDREKEKFH